MKQRRVAKTIHDKNESSAEKNFEKIEKNKHTECDRKSERDL